MATKVSRPKKTASQTVTEPAPKKKPAKTPPATSPDKKINCQLPGWEEVLGGVPVEDVIADQTEKKRHAGRPPIFTKAEDMQAAIDDYFESCFQIVEIKKGEGETQTIETKRVQCKAYTVLGLAIALNMCRDTLCEYAKNGEFSDTVKRAKQIVEESVEERLVSGKTAAAGPIFWLKNNSTYVDKQEQVHSGSVIHKIERTVVKPT